MPQKKTRIRLRQSEVFFPLAYHAIDANHVQSRQAFVYPESSRFSIDRVLVISDKVWLSVVNIVCIDNSGF